MTENFATTLIVEEDATGPAGLVAGPFMVNSISALLGREALTSLQSRDFWRAVTKTVPILSTFALGWEFDVGDSECTEIIFDALADPTRGDDTAGVRTWRMGRPDDIRRFNFIIDPVEGGHFELRAAALRSAQFAIERGRLATCLTQWVGRELTTDDSAPSSTAASNTRFASAPTCTITLDGWDIPVFSGAIAFNRDVQPAQFDLNNVASKWTGEQSVDVLGRINTRLSSGNFASLMRGGVIEKAITVTMTAGARVRVIELPVCRLEVSERTLVGEGTYEHLVQFAVVRSEGADIMTATSEDTP